jgi:DNA-binding winged helix-turn-helix (wHTH) protein/TolB-like protein
MSVTESERYRFGECELDPDERRLLAHGQPVTLTPKVFDTLVLLVRNAGHVVSKDELMHALWPRGFVDESNLTKHVWLIRKALGDNEHGTRWIETVPKLGYRFAAPVERVEERVPAPAPAPVGVVPCGIDAIGDAGVVPASEPVRSPPQPQIPTENRSASELAGRLRHGLAAFAALVVATGAVLWIWHMRSPVPPAAYASPSKSGSVAIVAFNNLSQNAKDAWLGPALGEMLATEISAGGRLHALPDELVRPAGADLPAPLAGGYASQSLSVLQRRLGSDYVLSGSYLVAGPADAPEVRLDLALQDARSGLALANLGRDAPVAELSAMVAAAGAELRARLGVTPASRGELQQVSNVQPPSADVARRIGFALDALHRNDPARARDELLDAVALAPGYAPAYSYLAQAWSALGYESKAAAAAAQAAAHAGDLPQEQQLQIRVQERATRHEWASAAATAAALVKLRPGNPDYRLRLIAIQLSGSAATEAQASLDALRAIPGADTDPRTELAAADVAGTLDDTRAAAVHARRALSQAQARDEPGEIADARHRLGGALARLGDPSATAVLRQAVADYQHMGNPHGEAAARDSLGKNLMGSGQVDAGREEYQRAMAIYQGIGDLGGIAATYTDLARMLWTAGDSDGAQAAARHVLETSREVGDQHLEAWSLQALAVAASDEAASDEVVQEYRTIIALHEKSANTGGKVWTLANFADVLRMRGELAEAQAACDRASDLVKSLTDPQFGIVVGFQCAQVALDRGDLPQARTRLAQSEALARSSGDELSQGNVDLELGQIDLGNRRWQDASAHLVAATRTFAHAQAVAGEADANALLAECESALGDAVGRDRAAARARELRGRINERQEVFAVDIAMARLDTAPEHADAAARKLRDLAADAEKRHWIGWALESRVALLGILEATHDPAAGALRVALAEDAREHGFGWVTQRLRGSPPAG